MPEPSITLSKPQRDEAIASLKRYADENLPDPLGDLAAGLLLNFFLEEIAPAVYNKAIHDAQSRLLRRLDDLPGELHEPEFPYWPRQKPRRR